MEQTKTTAAIMSSTLLGFVRITEMLVGAAGVILAIACFSYL